MKSTKLLQIEKDISDLLYSKLKSAQMTSERAKEIAHFVLETLPENLTDNQVEKIIPSLDDKFYELASIVYKEIQHIETTHREKLVNQAHTLINSGRVSQANNLMKDYFVNKHFEIDD